MAANIFELKRQKVQQRQTSQSQEELDALRRRLASLGGLDQGAAIRIEQEQRQKASERMSGALGEVDVEQQQYELAQQEAEKQRQFQAGEAEKQRGFAGSEALLERAQQERLLGRQQEFAGGQSELERRQQADILGRQQTFMGSESEKQRLAARELQTSQLAAARESQITDQDFRKLEGALGRDMTMKLQNDQIASSERLARMNDQLQRYGMVQQKERDEWAQASAENLQAKQLAYQSTKDLADRKILEKGMKNDLISGLMAQSIDLAQMAALGLPPSQVAAMMNEVMGNAMMVNDNGDLIPNKNWNPLASASKIEGYEPFVGYNQWSAGMEGV